MIVMKIELLHIIVEQLNHKNVKKYLVYFEFVLKSLFNNSSIEAKL